MKQYVKSPFLMAVFGLLCFEVQARDCVVHPYNAYWGQEAPAFMIMAKNTSCQTTILSSGQESIIIEMQSKNGIASSLPNGAKYKPNKDFVGNDEFVFMRKGTDKWGKPQESRVRVKVEVQKDKL